MIKIGILSDTHYGRPDSDFLALTEHCFADCEVIIHAGDLTDISVLAAFAPKKVYGVHGNMCSASCRRQLPAHRSFTIQGYSFGLAHGNGLGHDIENQLISLFPGADCLIYGHTHRPVCKRLGDILIINPGTFRSSGRYGASGTYAVLELGDGLKAQILEVGSAT